jgi:hypothetical protein
MSTKNSSSNANKHEKTVSRTDLIGRGIAARSRGLLTTASEKLPVSIERGLRNKDYATSGKVLNVVFKPKLVHPIGYSLHTVVDSVLKTLEESVRNLENITPSRSVSHGLAITLEIPRGRALNYVLGELAERLECYSFIRNCQLYPEPAPDLGLIHGVFDNYTLAPLVAFGPYLSDPAARVGFLLIDSGNRTVEPMVVQALTEDATDSQNQTASERSLSMFKDNRDLVAKLLDRTFGPEQGFPSLLSRTWSWLDQGYDLVISDPETRALTADEESSLSHLSLQLVIRTH